MLLPGSLGRRDEGDIQVNDEDRVAVGSMKELSAPLRVWLAVMPVVSEPCMGSTRCRTASMSCWFFANRRRSIWRASRKIYVPGIDGPGSRGRDVGCAAAAGGLLIVRLAPVEVAW
jgi:hypothetical protein